MAAPRRRSPDPARSATSAGAQPPDATTPPWWPLLLFAGSLLLRLLYLMQVRDNPTFLFPTADPLTYHQRALEILAGDLLGREVFFHSSPLYPYFLAFNYLINGQSIFWTYAVQALIDALGVVLIWALARRLAGFLPGILAALLAMGYQAFIFFTGEMLEISLVLTSLTAALWLLTVAADRTVPADRGIAADRTVPADRAVAAHRTGIPRRARRRGGGLLFLAGAALGLASLGKPNLLATIPFLLWGWKIQTHRSWRRLLTPALLCLLGTALVIAPVTLRNRIVGGDWVLTTSNAGINFYIGNNAEADGTFHVHPGMQDDLGPASAQAAELAAGHPLAPSEVSRHWFARGLEFVGRHPLAEIRLLGRKLLLLLNAYEIPNHFDLNFFQRYSSLLRSTPARFGTVAPFALAGLVLAWRRRRRLAMLYAFLASYAATILAFFVTARYRLPAVPVLLVFAGITLATILYRLPWIARRLPPPDGPRLDRRSAPALAAILIAALVLVHWPLHEPEDFYAHQHGAIASVYKQQGRFREAADEYRRALELAPGSVLMHNSLGVALLELGDTEGGEAMVRAALARDPSYAPAWRNLGRLQEMHGDTLKAIDSFRRAFDEDPYFASAGIDLARLLYARRADEESARVLRRVLARTPDQPDALWNLAVLCGTRLGQRPAAIDLLDRLLRLVPDHPQAARLHAYLRSQEAAGGASR
ncbi:MAG: tetratricopeptide repeat protein [Candidatus Eisenbacteria sp.]|nr:tetratricopeptide repeat protein [Candidatus Eisenbacteria bacterium]